MRVLVTGGAGFLGSHLCERLLGMGQQVTCLDNFQTGRIEHVAELRQHRDFSLLEHDITESFRVDAARIFNLASPASPRQYQDDPIGTLKTNVCGSLNVLSLAKQLNARVLQASTSEVYGDPTVHPQPESYWGNVNPIGSRACYNEGKRCAETLFFDHHRRYGMAIKVVRIFNTYGPRMLPDDGRVVSNFIVQALKGEDITLFGEGSQTRSFCYVDDLIDALVAMMESPRQLTGPLNLGDPKEITIADLAAQVIDLTGSRSRVVRRPLPQDDPTRRRPDIRAAREALGWQPQVELKEGLMKTIAYFEGVLRGGDDALAEHPDAGTDAQR